MRRKLADALVVSLEDALTEAGQAATFLAELGDPWLPLAQWASLYQRHLLSLPSLQQSALLTRLADGGAAAAPAGQPELGRFLVVIGPDPGMQLDMTVLRGLRERAGVQFTRMENKGAADLLDELTRARRLQRPYRQVHFGVHGSTAGLQVGNDLVAGDWLSNALTGVEVCLLAACSATVIADWISVVPWVVSFREQLNHEDAAHFAQGFWTGIYGGRSAEDAVAAGLQGCSPEVAEYVETHW